MTIHGIWWRVSVVGRLLGDQWLNALTAKRGYTCTVQRLRKPMYQIRTCVLHAHREQGQKTSWMLFCYVNTLGLHALYRLCPASPCIHERAFELILLVSIPHCNSYLLSIFLILVSHFDLYNVNFDDSRFLSVAVHTYVHRSTITGCM